MAFLGHATALRAQYAAAVATLDAKVPETSEEEESLVRDFGRPRVTEQDHSASGGTGLASAVTSGSGTTSGD